MKQALVLLLKPAVVIVAAATLLGLLWFPHLEGRNINSNLQQIYLEDPFLIYIYVASVPFFIALYQAYKLLENVGKNKIKSQSSVKYLQNIQKCIILLIAGIALAEVFIIRGPEEDIAGILAFGFYMVVTLLLLFSASAKFQKKLQVKL